MDTQPTHPAFIPRCPICREPITLQPGIHRFPFHHGLPPGWDCCHAHASTTLAAEYEQARLDRLLEDIQEALAQLDQEHEAIPSPLDAEDNRP